MKEKVFSINELAGAVGVSTSTLRAWERRYGLLQPMRTSGGHRVYSEADVRLYLYVIHLRSQGHDLGQIASRGKEALWQESLDHFAAVENPNVESNYEAELTRNVISALRAREYSDALQQIELAAALENEAGAFANVAVGVMAEVGKAWQLGHISVAAEHLVTSRVRYLMAEKFYRMPEAATSEKNPVAVCAGISGESHEMGILRVAIYLKQWGYRVYYLGPNNPVTDLSDFASEVNPQLICLSATCSWGRNNALQQVEKINHVIAARYPTVMGGSLLFEIEPDHPACSNITLTQDIHMLEKLALQLKNEN